MMHFLPARPAWRPAFAQQWRALDTQAGWRRALWLAPLALAILAMLFGQDDNWDLHNYHLYGPYSLLNGKVGLDLAPGQWQGYFNPTLDLLYYGLAMHLPGPLVSLVMGGLHGLNFALLAALGRLLLPRRADGHSAYRLSLMLAGAGCLGPAFISELSNSMGDNMTALLVLGALLLVLRGAVRDGTPQMLPHARTLLLAGLIMGLGTGMKLTNAGYALALCAALMLFDGSLLARVRAGWLFGMGVLAGIALSAGHWYWRMWQVFGNPLFPQFNDKFQSPMAAPIGIGDTGWLPKGLGDKLLWPFLFTLEPKRISELALRHLLWPVLYVAVIVLALLAVRALWRGHRGERLAPGARVLLAFVGLGYLVWLNLFSIYRYLVPLELLAPLLCWLLMQRLWGRKLGPRVGAIIVAVGALSVLSMGGWGHAGRSWKVFDVTVPAIAEPTRSMMVTVHADPPLGWLVPFFPRDLAVASLGGGFPESEGYRARAAAMLAERSAAWYVLMPADRHHPWQARSETERQQAQERDRQYKEKTQTTLASYGLEADLPSCRAYPAFIGRSRYTYQLCILRRAKP